ncbi:hypothetical protein Tco_0559685 [Tanacetum coccineum]
MMGTFISTKQFLNIEPTPPPNSAPNQENYFSETRKDIKICEANSSVNEPPEVELKDLPPHLEYAFLEGDDKLPVIIAKDLKNEEKAALIEVPKSPQSSHRLEYFPDIKGSTQVLYPQILMEEDYEPTVSIKVGISSLKRKLSKTDGGGTFWLQEFDVIIPRTKKEQDKSGRRSSFQT